MYSDPTGVNNGGFVVGYAYGSGQVRDAAAIRWSPDLTPTTLPPLPGEDYAEARGVNDANLAIGISWPASRDYSRATAVRWAADGTPTALLPLPGDLYSRPTAIGSAAAASWSGSPAMEPPSAPWPGARTGPSSPSPRCPGTPRARPSA